MVISHTYVTPMNQRKVQALCQFFDRVSLVTPTVVKDTLRTIHFKAINNNSFIYYNLKPYFDYHNSLRCFNPLDLESVIKKERPDFVLLEQEPYSISSYQVSRLKRRFGFKLLTFTFQNIYKKYPFPFSYIERSVLQATDLLIVGNDSGVPVWAKKGYPHSKMIVLPQVGVDLDEFYPMDKEQQKNQYKLSGFTIGYAGRFVEEKGILVLIEAFSKIKSQDAQLALVGRGPQKNELITFAEKLQVLNRIKFIEGIHHEEMSQLLNALDVLVLPSLIRPHWREQFGHVLIEAMACGVPCIGSDIDPINKIIDGCGYTFKEGLCDELVASLERLMNNYSQFPQAKLVERVANNYTNQVIASSIKDICITLK